MKKLLVLIAILFLFTGCATTKIATNIGTNIGDSFIEAAEKGEISAEESIKAWPYVSGLIRGVLAANYDIDVPPIISDIMADLDKLAAKKTLTKNDKGRIIGSYVRLEKETIKLGLDKYGINIMALITKSIR